MSSAVAVDGRVPEIEGVLWSPTTAGGDEGIGVAERRGLGDGVAGATDAVGGNGGAVAVGAELTGAVGAKLAGAVEPLVEGFALARAADGFTAVGATNSIAGTATASARSPAMSRIGRAANRG